MKAKYNPWLAYLSLPKKSVGAVVFDKSTWRRGDNENEKISEDTVKRMDEEGKITKTEDDKASR